MSGYIKYFETGGKSMSFMIKDDNILGKYNEIWDKIRENLNIKFHSKPVYDHTYIKAKVREFEGVIKTNFLGDEIPKENMHYACIACITIDSVMKMVKKNYPQVFLEECKYKVKKIQKRIQYQRKKYQELVQYKKEALKNNFLFFLSTKRMSEKTLKFNN